MSDTSNLEFYVVELFAEDYQEQESGSNTHTLSVPIVDGPFESPEAAETAAPRADVADRHGPSGYAVVSVPNGAVPEAGQTRATDQAPATAEPRAD